MIEKDKNQLEKVIDKVNELHRLVIGGLNPLTIEKRVQTCIYITYITLTGAALGVASTAVKFYAIASSAGTAATAGTATAGARR